MLSMNPARKRPVDRKPTESDKTPEAQVKTWPAPVGGWVSNVNPATAPQQAAAVLENFLPTERGIKPRGGYVVKATVAGAVGSLFQYRAGGAEKFFAADGTAIYEFSEGTAEGTALTAVVTGQTGSDYSTVETETAGGSFLTAVNGKDTARQYNGTTWSALTFTGVDTARLSQVWAHANRQYFIEKGTMSAWYLGINSISGTATELPLSGVFNLGGSLLFGATWSSDTGDGPDDRCAFFTDQGEVAVYSGGDPSSASTWTLDGVYNIGPPLGRDTHFKVGGDIIVATQQGLIPLSAAVSRDSASLSVLALSAPIGDEWQRAIALGANDWKVSKFERGGIAFVSPPAISGQPPRTFAVNLKSGAWSLVTGWDVKAAAALGDYPYFGSGSRICKAETGGRDDGVAFVCRAAYVSDHLGAPGSFKLASAMRATWEHRTSYTDKVSVASDYRQTFPVAPAAASLEASGTSLWDVSAWDVTPWGTGLSEAMISGSWRTVSANGRVLAPQVQLLSSDPARLDCELLTVDLIYSTGLSVV